MRTARGCAHDILREMKLPCGYLAEPRDEGDGWIRMPVSHALDCDRLTAAIEAHDAEHAAKRDRLREALGVAVTALEGIIPASLRDGKPFVCGECGAGIGAFPHRSHCTLGPAIEIVERALARISQLTKEGT